jgi:hypothetical protein
VPLTVLLHTPPAVLMRVMEQEQLMRVIAQEQLTTQVQVCLLQ